MDPLKGSNDASNLKIGDVVLLYYSAENSFVTESAGSSGFILGDVSGSGSQQLLTVQPAEISQQNLPNLQFGTFKVLSSNKHEAQTQYRTLLEKLQESRRKKVGRRIIQLLQLEVAQAKRDSEVERSENAAKQRRLQGTNVYYGDSIQLCHTLTNKYICVSATDTSKTENTKLRVYLQKKDSVGCIFRLHPHIKVQTIGEEVNYDDQIKFESVATEGQYLHCSRKTFGDVNIPVLSECYELNLAAKGSPLNIIHHYHPHKTHDSTLKASGIVRLFYSKHQCYVVGEGSFAGRYGHLPDTQEEDESSEPEVSIGQHITLSSRKRVTSNLRLLSQQSSKKIIVKADVEPTSSTDLEERVVMNVCSSESQLGSPEAASLSASLPPSSPSRLTRQPELSGSGINQKLQEDLTQATDHVVSEDVHFRRKRRTIHQSSQASTSPDTFWQIEKFGKPFSGDSLCWSDECRLKHLPTRQYLAVTQDHKVTLKSEKLPASSTVFQLFPVIQQAGGEVHYDSHVRVKHKDTGTWLHLDQDFRYLSEDMAGEETAEEMGGMDETSESDSFQVVATKQIKSEDCFTIEKVEDQLVTDFNYIAGITNVLVNQLQQCELLGGDPHSPEDCQMGPALSSLYYLRSLLVKDKAKIKTKQKFIRCLRTLVLVVRLLTLHKNENSNDPEVCTACFGVIINFLEGKSKKNKLYVSSMMKHIFTPTVKDTELLGNQTVEKALVGIAKDNPNVLYEEKLMQMIIDYLMQKLQAIDRGSTKAVQLLEILGALCTCKGVPVKQNQLIILEQLRTMTSTSDEENKLLYSLRVEEVDSKEVVINLEDARATQSTSKQGMEICIHFQALATADHNHSRHSILRSGCWYPLSKGGRHLQGFLLAQLKLLVQMCRGDNVSVMHTIQHGEEIGVQIDFDLIISAIKDKKIRTSYPLLRAVFIELMKVMYVEVGHNRPYLEKLPISFKINEVGRVPFESSVVGTDQEKACMTALTGVENPHFPAIKQWIESFLRNRSEFFYAADEDDRNEVVVKVLELLAVLVKFGYYDDSSDIEPLLPSIEKLLSGSDDYPTRQIKASMEWTFRDELHRRVAHMKKSFIRPTTRARLSVVPKKERYNLFKEDSIDEDLSVEHAGMSDSQVEKTLAEFRKGGKRYQYREEHHNHFKIKYWAMEVLNLLFNFKLYKSLHSFIYDFRWLAQSSVAQEEMEADDFELVAVKQPDKLKSELYMLLATNPRDPVFTEESPKLAKEIISSTNDRLQFIIKRADILDLSFDQLLPKILLDLANYKYDDLIQHSLLLLDRYYTSQSEIFQKALQAQLLLTPQSVELYNTVESLFTEQTAFLRSASVSEERQSPVSILTKYCWLEGEVEGYEAHQINQNIIISFGILPDILGFVLEYCDGLLSVDADYKKKLEECLTLLRALACQNPPVQNRLLLHLDAFLKAIPGDLGPNISELLHEIFRGGPSITLSLKEEQIWKMICLIFAKGKEKCSDTNAELLEAIHEFLIVKELGLQLKRNQLIVVKFISSIREDEHFWCRNLLAEGRRLYRWGVVMSKDNSDPRLHNLLMITDLLATCAYGGNNAVESLCCTIYSEEELIEIISSKQISLYRKRPFLKLLVWVFMKVCGRLSDERLKSYLRNKLLWDHMKKMADIIMCMAETMKGMSHSSYLSVKELLSCSSWKYMHECPDRKHTQEPPRIVMQGEDDYKEHFQIADLLLYINEAFFPFLQLLYSEFYSLDICDQIKLENDCTGAVFQMMLSLHPVLICKRVYFSQEEQVKLYYRVLFLVNTYGQYETALSAELHQINHSIEMSGMACFQQELVSEAREKYEALYEEERDLNEAFGEFVRNYKAACEGRNTRAEQILDTSVKHNKDLPYSDFLDEDMTKPGPKFLPLGRGFQEHVAIFNSSETFDDRERNPKDRLLKQLEISLSKDDDIIIEGGNLDFEEQAQLDIKCLQILRATIYNKIILINEEDKERNPKKYRRQCVHLLHPVQNGIQDLGNAISRVMPLLSHSNERIVYEVLAFLEALLEFGNTHVQDGLKEIIETREHQVFPTLKAILKKAAIVYRESQLLISSLMARQNWEEKIVAKALNVQEADDIDFLDPENIEARLPTLRGHKKSIGDIFRKTSADFATLVRLAQVENRRVPFQALYQMDACVDKDTGIGGKAYQMLHFSDISRISLMSSVLQHMCDGQRRDIQNYLREQSDGIDSVNMVEEVANFLYEFSKKQVHTEETISLFNNLLQALTEFCIGNYRNRQVVFNANIMHVINYVLHIDITKIRGVEKSFLSTIVFDRQQEEDDIDYITIRKMALQLKASTVHLLDALLEEISNKSSTLSHQIADGLDINSLHWSMMDFFVLKSDPDLIRIECDDDAERALYISYKIIQHLADSGFASLESLTPTDKNILKAWEYCEERSMSIEVVYRDEERQDEELTRVHFNVNMESEIRENLKEKVKYKVDRSTHGDKLRDFHQWMFALKKDSFHRVWLKRQHLNLVELFSKQRYWLLLLTTLILNIFLIIYFAPHDNEKSCPSIFHFHNGTISDDEISHQYTIATFFLGSLYAFLSIWMLLEYFIVTWPHFILPELLYTFKDYCKRHYYLSWLSRFILLPKVERTYLSVNILGVKTIYLVLLLVIAASPFYCFGYLYCLSFLYIIKNNDILQRALQSVTKNWKSLLWVAVLLLIVLYIYAIISFAVLRHEFRNPADSQTFCQTIDECFVSILRYGLLDSFLELGVQDAKDARARLFFDISFFIIITTIGLNIVFGIIIDTFSELRDARFHAEQDMKSNCFICGLPSHEFDKLGNNEFERHVTEDHNMWAYVYYSIYLDQIDVTNHNAIEKYVYEKIKSGSIDYIPFEKALVLESLEEGEELKKEVEHLRESMDEKFNQLSESMSVLQSLLQAKKEV